MTRETSILVGMKPTIRRLIQAEEDAKRKEAYLLSSEPVIHDSTKLTRSKSTETLLANTTSALQHLEVLAVDTTLNGDVPLERELELDSGLATHSVSKRELTAQTNPDDAVIDRLKKLKSVLAEITLDVEQVIMEYNASLGYRPERLRSKVSSLLEAMNELDTPTATLRVPASFASSVNALSRSEGPVGLTHDRSSGKRLNPSVKRGIARLTVRAGALVNTFFQDDLRIAIASGSEPMVLKSYRFPLLGRWGGTRTQTTYRDPPPPDYSRIDELIHAWTALRI